LLAFAILATVMIVGAIGVVTLRQPVHAALSLVGTVLALAVFYITLHAQFLAAVQVIVYAGAIMVLFLFVIMLLNVQGDEEQDHLAWIRPLAFVVGAVAAVAVAAVAFTGRRPPPTAEQVVANLQGGNAGPIADVLFTDFMLPFQLIGVLLLVSIVGAVGLVQRKAESARRAAERERERELTNV
jgi:NADH-quinone oxidoreductase subunit J